MEESLVEKIKIGNSNREEKLKLAEIFLKKNKLKLSKNLFEENLYKSLLDNEINTIFNYGTLLLKMGNIEKGIGILERLKYSRKLMNAPTRDLDEKINSNILYSIKIRKERRIDKKNENKKHERNKEKKIVASKKRSIRKYELLLKLKNKILKIKKNREKREYGGVISHLVNEDENLQKKIIKINIYSTQREKFKKDW
jgi:hypothetical protein